LEIFIIIYRPELPGFQPAPPTISPFPFQNICIVLVAREKVILALEGSSAHEQYQRLPLPRIHGLSISGTSARFEADSSSTPAKLDEGRERVQTATAAATRRDCSNFMIGRAGE